MNLRKGDLVEVICGEERGRRGKILRVKLTKDSGRYRVFVEGLNLAKKHQRAQGTTKPGGIVDLPTALTCQTSRSFARSVASEPGFDANHMMAGGYASAGNVMRLLTHDTET